MKLIQSDKWQYQFDSDSYIELSDVAKVAEYLPKFGDGDGLGKIAHPHGSAANGEVVALGSRRDDHILAEWSKVWLWLWHQSNWTARTGSTSSSIRLHIPIRLSTPRNIVSRFITLVIILIRSGWSHINWTRSARTRRIWSVRSSGRPITILEPIQFCLVIVVVSIAVLVRVVVTEMAFR